MSQSPFNFGKVHELETVTLRLSSASSAHLVAGHLAGLGFVVEDDFAYLPRSEPVPPWQASDVCQVSFYNAAEEVVDLEGVCDRLTFEYLFASLPGEIQEQFLHVVEAVRERLGGHLEHRGRRVGRPELLADFGRYADEIREEFADEPGTDSLQRLISEFRPRR